MWTRLVQLSFTGTFFLAARSVLIRSRVQQALTREYKETRESVLDILSLFYSLRVGQEKNSNRRTENGREETAEGWFTTNGGSTGRQNRRKYFRLTTLSYE